MGNPKTKKTNLYNQVENMKRKEEQKQDFFLGLFSSRASRKKNAYIKKKMYKKIEKSSKICLCMIKKTSCPYTQKSIPPKNKNRPLNIKFKKTKKNEKIRKNQRKILKFSLFLT